MVALGKKWPVGEPSGRQHSYKCAPISLIGALGFFRSPATILWLIISIWINAVKRCPRWSRPHISKKIFELYPRRANPNPPCAVPSITAGSRAKTARFHTFPGGILRGVHHAVLDTHILSKASARSRPALIKIARSCHDFFAAVTSTTPARRAVFGVGGALQYCQAGKPASGKVDWGVTAYLCHRVKVANLALTVKN